MTEPTADRYNPSYFRAQGWWRDETLGSWLELCAASRGAHPAVLTAGQSISYADLTARVAAFASGLYRVGIAPGDVVAVHLPNIPEFLIAWFAINARGAIMQTIHMPYGM